MARILIRQVMTFLKDCAVVKPGDTIAHLKQELRKNSHRAAIVISEGDGKLAGVITTTDLYDADDEDFISDHYTKTPITVEPDKPTSIARGLLSAHKVRELIVINDNDEPLGILWDFDAVVGSDDQEKKS